MRLNLFDYPSQGTKRLLTSLKNAAIHDPAIIIHPNGAIDKSIYNPFLFFLSLKNEGNGLYFNQLPVPFLYEIRHKTYSTAEVLDGVRLAAKIHYYENTMRLIEKVEWFDMQGTTTYIDYYTIYGEFFARGLFDANKKENRVQYFDTDGNLKIVWHKAQGHITLYEGDTALYFENLTQFTLFFIKQLQHDNIFGPIEHVLINNLSFPLFVVRNLKVKTTLFWQEHIKQEVPKNFEYQLLNRDVFDKVLFENKAQRELIAKAYPNTHVDLNYLPPLFIFKREHHYGTGALIVTKSDQLYHIEELLVAVPNYPITIAAPTMMSQKLLDLGMKYPQITLVPAASKARIDQLLTTHDVYLNINAGSQVDTVIEDAYLNNMIILSLDKVSKNRFFEWNFTEVEFQLFIKTLIRIRANQMLEEQIYHEFQQKLAMPNKKEYRELLLD